MHWMHAISCALLLGVSSTAGAASAIAYDADGAYGYSMNQATVSAAMQNAVKYCAARSHNCGQSAVASGKSYSAIFTGTVSMGFALAEASPEGAQRKADKMCRERANDCTLAVMWGEQPSRVIERPWHPGAPAPTPAAASGRSD
ncbi:hypothetical protein D3C81_314890 [compost metagenome]|uniref:DUF4189 domain-containing protein n=1 Tax=Stenotrophomonas TaxID=40323 RepID=UPI000FB5E382|nr:MULTISPECIES: DUF4189 domain-containing protein [Stenotrophomonas]MCF5091342.1 DUF4189 domain-containing protein [Stenotrophomonas sp. PA-6-5C]